MDIINADLSLLIPSCSALTLMKANGIKYANIIEKLSSNISKYGADFNRPRSSISINRQQSWDDYKLSPKSSNTIMDTGFISGHL